MVLQAGTFALLLGGLQSFAHESMTALGIAEVAGGCLLGILLVRHEIVLDAPLIPFDLLRVRLFSLSVVTSIGSFMAQTTGLVALPFEIQHVGHSAAETGLLMTPWPVGVAVAAPLAGRLADRYPAGILASLGLFAMAAGLSLLALFPPSVVESKRLADGRVAQRHVLYLGEINSSQQLAWRKSIEVFDEARPQGSQTIALFAEDRYETTVGEEDIVRLRLSQLRLERPRQWGGCWLALELWRELGLDAFWAARLPPSRKGTCWDEVLLILVVYRLLSPGSEWRLHREWYGRSALADLLDTDEIIDPHVLYECHDLLLEHKAALFDHLVSRWRDLFNVSFEVLLYDLTSTYFEIDPPLSDSDKRQFGYSRDKRSDCVQVVIALIVTPQGFPLAYEVLSGNTADKTTLKDFLARIERQYGKARRVWVMDRGIPTEEVLEQMRTSDPPVQYLVGTPKGRLTGLERSAA